MKEKRFDPEIKKQLNGMSEDEIMETINALKKYKSEVLHGVVSEKKMLSNMYEIQDNGDESKELVFSQNGKPGKLVTYGADFLTIGEYKKHKEEIPVLKNAWFLKDWCRVFSDHLVYPNGQRMSAAIRPALRVELVSRNNPELYQSFYINGEEFILLSEHLALRMECLLGDCSFEKRPEGHTIADYCIKNWWDSLIKENEPVHLSEPDRASGIAI